MTNPPAPQGATLREAAIRVQDIITSATHWREDISFDDLNTLTSIILTQPPAPEQSGGRVMAWVIPGAECDDRGWIPAKAWTEDEFTQPLYAAPKPRSPRFATTSCSQCGGEFGPGDAGFSHCEGHAATPTAEPVGEPKLQGWQPIETAPKDGTLIVVRGNNYNNADNGQHHCIACWFNGCWAEASDWNPTSELTYLTHWAPMPDAMLSASPAAPESAKPEQQAQAGEPEVLHAGKNGEIELITLQAHREEMEAESARVQKLVNRQAAEIAKRDAALKACVGALDELFYSNSTDAAVRKYKAAITQAEGAMK